MYVIMFRTSEKNYNLKITVVKCERKLYYIYDRGPYIADEYLDIRRAAYYRCLIQYYNILCLSIVADHDSRVYNNNRPRPRRIIL